jgi:hypothetical protein
VWREGATEHFEPAHDERVASEHRRRFSEETLHGGLSTPCRGIVEAREVVVYERSAVEELDGDRGGELGGGVAVGATGAAHGEHQLGPEPPSAREDRVSHGGGELRWPCFAQARHGSVERGLQRRGLQRIEWIHGRGSVGGARGRGMGAATRFEVILS